MAGGLTQPAGTVTDPAGRIWVADRAAGFCRVSEPSASGPGSIETATCIGGSGASEGPVRPGSPAFVDPTTGSPGSGDEIVLVPDSAPGSSDVTRARWNTSNQRFQYYSELTLHDGDLRPKAVSYGADRDAYVIFEKARAVLRIVDPTAVQPDIETVAYVTNPNPLAIAAAEVRGSGNRITVYVVETSGLRSFVVPTEGDRSSQAPSASYGVGVPSALHYDAATNALYAGTATATAAGQDVIQRVNTDNGSIEAQWATGFTRVGGLGMRDGKLLVTDDAGFLTSANPSGTGKLYILGQAVVQIVSGPTAADGNPAPNPALTNDSTPTFTVSSTPAGPMQCSLRPTGSAAVWTDCTSGTYTPSSPLADGAYTFAVRSGATGQPATREFTIDTVAPAAPTIGNPSEGEVVGSEVVLDIIGPANASLFCAIDSTTNYQPCKAGDTLTFQTDGNHVLRAKAVDAAGNSSPVVTVNFVVQGNAAPVANAGADRNVVGGTVVQLNGGASSDPENSPLTFAWTQTAGPAVTLTGESTPTPTFTAPAAGGNLTFRLVVGDGSKTSAPDTVTINASARSNAAPTANAGADATVAGGAQVQLNGTGSTDPDGNPLTYLWTQTGGPAVSLVDSATATPKFTAPVPTAPTTLTFSLTVGDGQVTSGADTVQVTVNPAANKVPTAHAGPDQIVNTGTTVTLNGTLSSDPDPGTTLTYEWTQAGGTPVTLTNATTSTPSFAAPAAPATITFDLVVDDGAGGVSPADSVTISVTEVAANQVPVANAGADQTVLVGANVQLDGSLSGDPNPADTLAYQWTQVSGTSVTLSGPTTASPTFTAPAAAGVLTFELVVNDGTVASPVDEVTVTVAAPPENLAPTANAGPDRNVVGGTVVQLNGGASTDPEKAPLSFVWTQVGGPAVTLSGATTATPTFTAPPAGGAVTFQLVVGDGEKVSPADAVVITATAPPNQAPTANAGQDRYVMRTKAAQLNGTASTDPDNHPLSFAWTQTSGLPVTLSNPTSAMPTFTAPSDATTLVFSLVVNDGRVDSAADTVSVTVTPFTDVQPGAAFFADIQWMAERRITTGTPQPDGTLLFEPRMEVRREAMAAFLYRFSGSPAYTPPATSPFIDIPTNHPFYKEIAWLAASGISTGTPVGNGQFEFRPNESVTREATSAFLYRQQGSPAFTPPATSPFVDVPTNHPFYKQISWMAANGISTGTNIGGGRFEYRPLEPVTREATAAFLHRTDLL